MSETSSPKLKRDITFLTSGFLILNSVIGAGIFALPERMYQAAGDFSPWLFPIMGLMMMSIVLSFARITSFFRLTGGPSLYATAGFGPFVGFQVGWLFYVARVLAFAANTNVLIMYSSYLLPDIASGTARTAAIFFVCLFLTMVNYYGVKRAMQALTGFTYLKVIPIILLIIFGLPAVGLDIAIPSDPPPLSALDASILILMYAFVGFEGAIVSAGEMKNPRRNLPRALIGTILAITLIYTLIQAVYTANISGDVEAAAPLIALGSILGGDIGAIVITLAAIFSIGGNLTSSLIAAPRVSFSLAKDKLLPKWFGHIHEKYATPDYAILFTGVLVFILTISGSFVLLAAMSSVARMLIYATCIASLPKIERAADEETRNNAYKIPGGMIIPVIGIAFSLWAAAQSSLEGWKILGIMALVGTVLYLISKRSYQNEDKTNV